MGDRYPAEKAKTWTIKLKTKIYMESAMGDYLTHI